MIIVENYNIHTMANNKLLSDIVELNKIISETNQKIAELIIQTSKVNTRTRHNNQRRQRPRVPLTNTRE